MAAIGFPNRVPSLSIDRRRLLTTVAALAAAGRIAPNLERIGAAMQAQAVDSVLTPAKSSKPPCTPMARRLAEIARRNEIRREAALPLLSTPKELRRMKQWEKLEEFERFKAELSKAVWDEVLRPRREAESNPNWRPSWMEGLGYQGEVNKILWGHFDTRAVQPK